ncbi:DUF2975 domain-containing protein [uncultured Roseovarius sp.]|uniref:DUF2975 domain-containing protein n=1 Tax=uncultured Roseovarius sp. TaxID=293344 RepID=UPI0026194BC6|nr:DUF2975 domain-containing protein [uncultured Roseovarius sp.]
MSNLPCRTQKLARFLRLCCFAAMAGVLAVAVYVSIAPDRFVAEAARAMMPGTEVWDVGNAATLLLYLVAAVNLGIVLFVLWQVARLTGCYGTGDALSSASADAIRWIGLGLLTKAVIGVLDDTATGLILSIDAPSGQGMLVISFGSTDIWFALAGGLMLLIGLVMLQAVDVAEDNRGFV